MAPMPASWGYLESFLPGQGTFHLTRVLWRKEADVLPLNYTRRCV